MTTESLTDLKNEIARTGAEAVTDQAPVSAASPAPAPSLFDRDAEARAWAELPQAVGALLSIALPSLKDVYTPEACARWGAAMVDVAAKYGWSARALGPWVGLAAATVPLAVPTFLQVKLARMKPEERAAATAAVNAATAATETATTTEQPVKVKPVEG